MYQAHVTVLEYPGCWAVRAMLTDRDDQGVVSPVAERPEVFIVLDDPSGDPLTDLGRALVQWCRVST